ncbi:LysR family transcriptional regulator [Defluviimonas sp. SAOS-178_SWC]|uniref:LysR family transcriptional regulator n=1 Tax=Defluviimonas sp. SAOS-178_SWC TaxID=3121287 RepID=UPI0032213BD8
MQPELTLKPTQLRLVTEIAEHGQLQLAANEIKVTQPAASRMLSEIERAVGAALFVRHPKGMEPTAVGHAVAKRARAMLRELHDLGHEVAILRAGRGGSVHVGAVTGPAVGYLVPAIQSIKANAPEAEITVDVAPSRQLLRDLAAGRLDFALARFLPDIESRDFDVEPMRDEKVSLLVRRDHPLSSVASVSLADLASYEWVMQERGAPIREAMNNAFGLAGLRAPGNIVNSSSLLLMIAYLTRTDAIAPVSEEVVQLLVGEPVSAGFTTLSLDQTIRVSPYFFLSLRDRPLSPLGLHLKDAVLLESRGGR